MASIIGSAPNQIPLNQHLGKLAHLDNVPRDVLPKDTSDNVVLGNASLGNTSIAANSTSNAVTITQTGTGNALVVEDSASTDSTPFVIDGAGNVVIGASSGNTSAKLQVDSTSQGFLPPRMTGTQRDAITSPAAGLEIFNTTTNTKQYYNGSSWVNLTASGGAGGVVVNTVTVDTGSALNTDSVHTITDASVTATSTVIANVSMTTTVDNTLDDHQHAAASWKLSCASGTGQFSLYIDALADMYFGTFKINYIVYN